MEIYLTEETFSRLLNSVAHEMREYYGNNFPVLIGVGISGVEIVGRMPEILDDSSVETYVCDVVRRGDAIEKVIDFPVEKVKGKRVLIAYVRVDTGKTLQAISSLAIESGATEVKTLSIAVRSGASCFPHFFCFIIKDEDNLYLLLDGYPPDIALAYPPVTISHGGFIRKLSHEDVSKKWFKCGDERIDKVEVGEYLYYRKISKGCRIFVIDDGEKIAGILHFYVNPHNVRIETLAIDENAQGQGIGSGLITFFINWCKFNGIRWIYLDAFHERESFYEGLEFHKLEEFEIPSYGRFSRMRRKVF